jgi:hypothetical protein
MRSFFLAFVVLAACGGKTSDPAPPDTTRDIAMFVATGCVTFDLEPEDAACTVDSDCSFIDELHVCAGDPSCGGEIPVNVAAADRYARAVAGIPRTQVECGVAAPVRCVAKKCAVVEWGSSR